MKCLLLLLAIGFTASEKLDRSYLPPPGAQYAGGNAGDIQAPLELPHSTQFGTIPVGQSLRGLQNFGPSGQPTLTPVTTTSYAFTQTTTYPPIVRYDTTLAPINPVTGLPVQNLSNQQYDKNFSDFAQNHQIISNVNQFPDQGENKVQIPGSVFQQPSFDDLAIKDHLDGQILNQNPSQASIYSGSIIPGAHPKAPENNQDVYNVPREKIVPGEQSFVSTINPQQITANNLPNSQYSVIDSQGPFSGQSLQGSYSAQPVKVQYSRKPEIIPGYPNDGQQQFDGTLSQLAPSRHQNILRPESASGQNIYQVTQDYNSVSSTTPMASTSSSTLSLFSSTIRPERPQAAADRNSVILNYENVRSPNSYTYNYDTSNGIHADETGIVNDGTKAQGSYSYTGDDGKIYTVTYTADENGFQPRGDHIPTPPPIPEAIREVIEQATRDEAAGIVDDGSYDENKYGDKQYLGFTNHRRPQIFEFDDKQDDRKIKPVFGTNNDEYHENPIEHQFTGTISNGEVSKKITKTQPSSRPFNKIADTSDNKEIISGDSKKHPENDDTLFDDKDYENRDGQDFHGYIPNVNIKNGPATQDFNAQSNKFYSKERFPGHRPNSFNRIKDTMQQPGSQIQETDDIDINLESKEAYDYDIDNVDHPNITENESNFPKSESSISDSNFPIIANRKQASKITQKVSKQPGLLRNDYIKGIVSVSGQSLNQGVNDGKNDNLSGDKNNDQNKDSQQAYNQGSTQQVDQNGYYYNPPRSQFQQTEFPNRFNSQLSSTKRPIYKSSSVATSVRPFITPEVYNQRSNGKKNQNQQSTTLKPFMTSRVTNSGPYDVNVDNQDDYNDTENFSLDKKVGKKGNDPSRKTYQTSTLRPTGQSVSQKGTARTNQKIDYSNTPHSVYKSTTSTPIQSSRFGSTESSQRRTRPYNKQYPSTTIVPSQESNYQYKDKRPVSEYFGSTIRPSSSPSPTFGTRLLSKEKTSQYSPTSTYTPASTTKYPPDFVSSGISETYQPGATDGTQTGYYYEPVQAQNSLTVRPQTPTSGSHGITAPGNYQITYDQGSDNFINVSNNPSTSDRPGAFILGGQGNLVSELVTNKPYQTFYQYGSTTPLNIPTIVTSAPETRPGDGSFVNYESLGSQSPQNLPGVNEYGISIPIYSTTVSPSTIGTTPSSFITSPIPGQSYAEYSSNPSTQGSYPQNPVVGGLGRPIVLEQQSSYPSPGKQQISEGSSKAPGGSITDSSSLPVIDTSGDNVNNPSYVDGLSPNYSGYYNRPNVNGEDFSGPKQPQSFDVQTGYHYK